MWLLTTRSEVRALLLALIVNFYGLYFSLFNMNEVRALLLALIVNFYGLYFSLFNMNIFSLFPFP